VSGEHWRELAERAGEMREGRGGDREGKDLSCDQ